MTFAEWYSTANLSLNIDEAFMACWDAAQKPLTAQLAAALAQLVAAHKGLGEERDENIPGSLMQLLKQERAQLASLTARCDDAKREQDAVWNDAVDACAEYITKNYYPPKWKAFGLAENMRGLKRYSDVAALAAPKG